MFFRNLLFFAILTVLYNAAAALPLSIIPKKAEVKPGERVTFFVEGGAGSYIWGISDGFTMVSKGPDYLVVQAPGKEGVYSVAVTDGISISISEVIVKKPERSIVTLRIVGPPILYQGESRSLLLIGYRSDLKEIDLTQEAVWESSNSSIVRVDGGVIYGISPGRAVVTASYDNKSADLEIEVESSRLVALKITPSTLFLSLGQSLPIEVKGVRPDGTEQDIDISMCSFEGEDSLISISNGVINAMAPGEGSLIIVCQGLRGGLSFFIAPEIPLTINPTSLTLPKSDSYEFRVNGGAPPYFAMADFGIVSIKGDRILYKAPDIAGEDTIVVSDSLGNTVNATISVVLPLTLSPQAVHLNPGDSVAFHASGGSGSYRWSATGGELSNTQGEKVTYKAPQVEGLYTVTLQDNRGQVVTAQINVGLGLMASPSEMFLALGQEKRFMVTGGIPPYEVTVSSGEVEPEGENTYIYKAPGVAGSYRITVTDSSGDSTSIDVTVARALTVSPTELFLEPEEDATLAITGGVGNYTVASSGGDVRVEGNVIYYKAPKVRGNYYITIYDDAGDVVEVSVQVTSGNFFTNQAKAYLLPGEETEIAAIGGSPPYTWGIEGEGKLSSTNGTKVTYKAPDVTGHYIVKVRDSEGREAYTDIFVYLGELEAAPSLVMVEPGGEAYITAVLGVPPYEWSVKFGRVEKKEEGKVLYHAPPHGCVDSVVLEDATGMRKVVRVVVSERIKDIVDLYAGDDGVISDDEMSLAISDFFRESGWITPQEMFRLIEAYLERER